MGSPTEARANKFLAVPTIEHEVRPAAAACAGMVAMGVTKVEVSSAADSTLIYSSYDMNICVLS